MCTADPLYIKTREFLECSLDRSTVFADYVGVVSYHLIPELVEGILGINDIIIDGTECSECIS